MLCIEQQNNLNEERYNNVYLQYNQPLMQIKKQHNDWNDKVSINNWRHQIIKMFQHASLFEKKNFPNHENTDFVLLFIFKMHICKWDVNWDGRLRKQGLAQIAVKIKSQPQNIYFSEFPICSV